MLPLSYSTFLSFLIVLRVNGNDSLKKPLRAVCSNWKHAISRDPISEEVCAEKCNRGLAYWQDGQLVCFLHSMRAAGHADVAQGVCTCGVWSPLPEIGSTIQPDDPSKMVWIQSGYKLPLNDTRSDFSDMMCSYKCGNQFLAIFDVIDGVYRFLSWQENWNPKKITPLDNYINVLKDNAIWNVPSGPLYQCLCGLESNNAPLYLFSALISDVLRTVRYPRAWLQSEKSKPNMPTKNDKKLELSKLSIAEKKIKFPFSLDETPSLGELNKFNEITLTSPKENLKSHRGKDVADGKVKKSSPISLLSPKRKVDQRGAKDILDSKVEQISVLSPKRKAVDSRGKSKICEETSSQKTSSQDWDDNCVSHKIQSKRKTPVTLNLIDKLDKRDPPKKSLENNLIVSTQISTPQPVENPAAYYVDNKNNNNYYFQYGGPSYQEQFPSKYQSQLQRRLMSLPQLTYPAIIHQEVENQRKIHRETLQTLRQIPFNQMPHSSGIHQALSRQQLPTIPQTRHVSPPQNPSGRDNRDAKLPNTAAKAKNKNKIGNLKTPKKSVDERKDKTSTGKKKTNASTSKKTSTRKVESVGSTTNESYESQQQEAQSKLT